MSVSNVLYAQDELCTDGILLFREDFGGNDPNDPMVSNAPMPGISSRYQQDYNYSAGRLAGMHYIIAKQGHPDSDSHDWHIMDDHTYPNDITRGYFFETNSRANSYYTNYIYQKEVAGLCAGMQLSFSAYFANVVTAREFKTVPFWSYSYPKFVFVVTDARTGEQLARYNTDTIGHDWSLYNIPDSWQYSAQWHLKGIKFTIPEGVDKVTLSIIDNPTQYGNAEGDDYAVDDIELHLCSNVEYQTVDTTICDTLLPFSWRGIEWIKADTIGKIYKDAQGNDSLYLVYSLRTIHCPYPSVSVSQDTTICDTLSQIKWHDKLYPIANTLRDTLLNSSGFDSIYYELHVATEHCEDFCLEGKLLFREDFGGNDPNDPEVSCSRVEGVLYKNACQTPDNISSGACLVTKRGRGYYERQWLDRADHTYPNDFSRGYYLVVNGDNNRLFYSIDLPGGESGSDFSFSAYVISLHESIYGDEERSDIYRCPSILFDFLNGSTSERITAYYTDDIEFEKSISEFKRWHLIGTKFTLPKDIPYIVLNVYAPLIGRIGNDFGLDDIEFRLCRKTEEQRIDTTVCDTLLPLVWLGRQWTDEGTLTDTLRYTDGGDSVYVQMSLHTQNCCPVSQTVLLDTLVCDTLLPFVWQGIIWQNAGIQEISIPHPKWTQCVDTNYIIHLDTVHCERLYPLIVNKYNWQLLCHNVRVRELFPELTVTGYQWFKDDTLIPGATEDDYSEQNELQGEFQLRLHMSDGRYVWSEILTIQPGQTQAPSRIRIYNHNGYLFYQSEKETTIPSLPRGLYIIQIEQNGEQRIEKKLIP